MKLIVITPLVWLLVACASEPYESDYDEIYSERIVGTWKCSSSSKSDSNASVSASEDVTYIDNGRFNSFGILKLQTSSERHELEYSMASTGTWNITNGKLYELTEDSKINNLTNPLIDKLKNLNDFIPKNLSESSSITSLNQYVMTLQSDSDGENIVCSKK